VAEQLPQIVGRDLQLIERSACRPGHLTVIVGRRQQGGDDGRRRTNLPEGGRREPPLVDGP
jgi:hypothetical protein